MKIDVQGTSRYIDAQLHENLVRAQQYIKKKWDNVIFISGMEGSGKTFLANQIASFLDPSFCQERTVFTPDEFMLACESAQPGQAVVYDEAQEIFESTNRSRLAMEVKDYLTRCRHKNLHIIICAPDFWRISRYLFLHRCRLFLNVYANGLERGYFGLWGNKKKRALWRLGKKTEDIDIVKPNSRGCFTKWFTIDDDEYEKRKSASYAKKKEDVPDALQEMITRIVCCDGPTIKMKCEMLGCSIDTYYRKYKKREDGSDSDLRFNSITLDGEEREHNEARG